MASRQSLGAKISLAFNYNGKRKKINPRKIIYLVIESDYENSTTPIIYLSLSVNFDLYSLILEYKDSATFYLNIDKTNLNSKSSLYRNHIKGNFAYIPSTTNPNYEQDLSASGESSSDESYKKLMIGLISIDLANNLRKSFNAVYRNIDTETLLGVATEGTNCIIEQPDYNYEYDQILIPPVSSRYQLIRYLFDLDAFYKTQFRFFMDFDRSYLISKSGKSISSDSTLDDVIIDIKSLKEKEAFVDGIDIKNNAYYVYVNPANANVKLDESTEKVANHILVYDDELGVTNLDLSINNRSDSTTKQIFLRSHNADFEKFNIETTAVSITLSKQYIDGSYFVPNKNINIINYDDYSKYNGKYNIVSKKECYQASGSDYFQVSCLATFEMINGSKTDIKYESSSTVITPNSTTTSSSDIINNTRSASGSNRAYTNTDETTL